MISKENYLGKVTITDKYIKEVIRRTVAGCFGVAGMKSGSFFEFVKKDILKFKSNNIGVYTSVKENQLTVNIHISVTYGTNINAVVRNIKDKVEFAAEQSLGIPVKCINVYVDDIRK